MIKEVDYNDILREDPDAILRMVDQAVLRQRLNGSARQEEDSRPPPDEAEELNAKSDKRERETAKIELPEGFIPESEIRPGAPAQLIKGMLPLCGTTLVVGQSGAKKSFTCVDMALAVSTGTSFFGHEVKNHGGVVYVAAEGGGGIGNRIKAAKLHRSVDRDIPLVHTAKAYNLKNDGELDELIRELKQSNSWFEQKFEVSLRLAIIDTMSVAFAVENENDNAQVADVCKRLQIIRDEINAHVLGVHHAGKNQEAGARGASAWRANVDNMLFCAADRNDVTGECSNHRLCIAKYRDGEEGSVFAYELTKINLGKNEDGEPYSSLAIVATGAKAARAPKRPTATERIFEDALNAALIDHGKEIRVHGDGPLVRAVDVDRVRPEFNKRYATGESNKEKRRSATSKAFTRALQSSRFGTQAIGDCELVWKL